MDTSRRVIRRQKPQPQPDSPKAFAAPKLDSPKALEAPKLDSPKRAPSKRRVVRKPRTPDEQKPGSAARPRLPPPREDTGWNDDDFNVDTPEPIGLGGGAASAFGGGGGAGGAASAFGGGGGAGGAARGNSRAPAEMPGPKVSVRFADVVRRPTSYAEWLESLPTPTVSANSSPSEWLEQFSRYIQTLLSVVYIDAETQVELVSEPYLRIFRRAFTDVSFSSDDNETLETLGDKMLGTVFTRYLKARKPDITNRVMTNFVTNYLSKDPLAKLATDLKMDKWMLLGKATSTTSATLSMREDAFESFIAAFDQAANALHQRRVTERRFEDALIRAPYGMEAVRVLVNFIYDSIGIDPKMGEDAAKSTLNDIGTIFGIRSRAVIFDSPPEGTINPRHSVRVNATLIAVLKEHGIDMPPVLSEGLPTKTEAANAALAVAESHGVTREWLSEMREVSRGVARLPEPLRGNVTEKAKRIGVTKVFSEIPERTRQPDGSYTVVLIGSTADDRRITLADAVGVSFQPTLESAARRFLE